MRSILISTVVAVFTLCLFAAPHRGAPAPTSFVGVVSDSQCAMNVHSLTRSHKEMLKSKTMGGTDADCARMCVKRFGGEFVLVSGDAIYRLDDQAAADVYAGRKVTITGTLDTASSTIHVAAIEPAK